VESGRAVEHPFEAVHALRDHYVRRRRRGSGFGERASRRREGPGGSREAGTGEAYDCGERFNI